MDDWYFDDDYIDNGWHNESIEFENGCGRRARRRKQLMIWIINTSRE